MESVLSFVLILGIYFLGSLALSQDYVKPSKASPDIDTSHSYFWKTIGISLAVAIPPAVLLYSFLEI